MLDLCGRAVEWPAVAAELERLRTSGGVHALVLAVDGATEVAGANAPGLLALFELPVVVALEGAVRRTAAALAFSCDIRVCDASLLLTLPPLDDRWRLLLGGTAGPAGPIGANEALARGLVSRVAGEDEPALKLAEKVGRVIAARGPIATRLGKEALWRGLAMPLEQALRFETDLTLLLQTTKDRAEGVRAFLEKRAPTFEGE